MCVNSRQNLSRDITICRIYQVRLWSLYVLWHISVGYHKTLLSPSLFFLPRKHLKECTCAPRCVCFEDFHSLPIWSWCICKIWRKLWFLCTKLKVLPSLADSFTALLACGQWCSGRHWPFRHQSPVSCVCFPFHRRRTKSSFKFHCRGSFGRHQHISTFEQRVQQKARLEDMMRHECLLTDCLTLILAIWEVSFYFKPGKVLPQRCLRFQFKSDP